MSPSSLRAARAPVRVAPVAGPGARDRSFSHRATRTGLIGAICALAAAVSLLTPVHQPDLAAQGARYLVLAQSLAEGSYRRASSPLREVEVTEPPLWPAALAVALALSRPQGPGAFLPVAQGVTLVLLLAFLALLFLFLERRAGGPVAAAVTLLAAVQPWIVPFGRNAMSEVPFMLLLVASLWSGASALRRNDLAGLLLALVLALAAAHVRLAGAVVVLALARSAWAAFPRHRSTLLVFAGCTLIWPLRQAAVHMLGTPATPTLVEVFQAGLGGRDYLLALSENVIYYPRTLVAAVFPTDLLRDPAVRGTLVLALWGLVAWGIVADWPADRGFAASVFLFMLAGLVLWPVHRISYLVPVLFLALYFAALGVRQLVELAGRGMGVFRPARAARLAPLLLLLLLVPYLRWDLRQASGPEEEAGSGLASAWRGYYRGLAWVGARAPDDAVLLARFPDAAYLQTGRPALPPESGWPLVVADRGAGAAKGREVWVVRDAFRGEGGGFPIAAGMLRQRGGRLEFVDRPTGVEVWSLPRRPGEISASKKRGRHHG